LREESKKESPALPKDRVLGDEWLDWKKTKKNNFEKIDEKKSVFLVFISLIVCISLLGILLLYYFVTPRLEQFHPSLPLIIGIMTFSLGMFILLEFLLFVISIYKEKNLGIKLGTFTLSMNFLFPFAFSLAKKLGFSIDRFGNSFIKVHNAITHALFNKGPGRKVLILLPRCLEKPLIKEIRSIGERYDVDTVIVSGGSKAREAISQNNPAAVIGIACERDLVSGIRDVSGNIPVIGIVNKRPKGPCKDTKIDTKEVEEAIKFFLKR